MLEEKNVMIERENMNNKKMYAMNNLEKRRFFFVIEEASEAGFGDGEEKSTLALDTTEC